MILVSLQKHIKNIVNVFFGSNRKKSEKYGMKVYLTPDFHRHYPNGVHVNRCNDLTVKRYAQQKFIEMYPDLDFRKIFGRSYL